MRRVEWKRIQREGQQGERLEAKVLFVSQLHKTEGHASFRGYKATAGAGCVSGASTHSDAVQRFATESKSSLDHR